MSKHKRNRSPFSWFTTYYIFFAFLIVGLEMFNAGADVHHRYFADMVFDIIISCFWAGIALLFSRMAYQDGKLDGDLEGLEKMGELLDALAKHEEEMLARKAAQTTKVPVKNAK